MNDLSLYGLTEQLVGLLDSDDEDAMVILEETLPVFERKAAAVAHFITYGEDKAKLLRARAAAFEEAARVMEARAERSRAYLKQCMESVEATRIEDKRSGTVIAIEKNGGKLPLVIEDEDLLRDAGYVQGPYLPPLDREAIRAALDAGLVVVGAKYGPRGTHLVIR